MKRYFEDMETVFAKIIKREIPAEIVYEDELSLAFLDINPVNPGHVLVIPKTAFVNIFDGDPELLAHMMRVAQKIGKVLVQSGLAEGVNLVMSSGAVAGQEVFHAHLHVIPRLPGDQAFIALKHQKLSPEEHKKIAEGIRGAF